MVGKLIKHELFSIVRIACIPAGVMVLLAVLSRIMLETSSEELTAIIFMFYMFSVIATFAIGFGFGIHSFYQSLFTGIGYLTLSLPVTANQLIWSKLISAVTVIFASIIVCLLTSVIFFIGLPAENYLEILEGLSILSIIIYEHITFEPLTIFELILSTVISIPAAFLLFYAMMCLGQLFTVKNRKRIAIWLYVGLIFVWSILKQTAIEPILEKATEVSIHLTMWLRIVFRIAVSIGCYFLVRYIIKNKVNLLV